MKMKEIVITRDYSYKFGSIIGKLIVPEKVYKEIYDCLINDITITLGGAYVKDSKEIMQLVLQKGIL